MRDIKPRRRAKTGVANGGREEEPPEDNTGLLLEIPSVTPGEKESQWRILCDRERELRTKLDTELQSLLSNPEEEEKRLRICTELQSLFMQTSLPLSPEREKRRLKLEAELESLTSNPKRINSRAVLQSLSSNPEHKALLHEWWASVEALLKFYGGEICLNPVPPVLPFELVNALGAFAGYLAVGRIPRPIANACVKGASPPGPSEKHDISVAVAYLAAAKSGAISDKAPVKTVCTALGVHRHTVQGWQKTHKPGGLGATPINAEILKSLMEQSGERYRSAGRSDSAIWGRANANSDFAGHVLATFLQRLL